MKTENLHDEIARVAYELYENSGCIGCKDLANWFDAERTVLTRHASQEIEEPEEVKQSSSERYPASRGTEELEESAVIEEIESIVAPKRGSRVSKPAEKHVSAKKGKPDKQSSTKVKKVTAKKIV